MTSLLPAAGELILSTAVSLIVVGIAFRKGFFILPKRTLSYLPTALLLVITLAIYALMGIILPQWMVRFYPEPLTNIKALAQICFVTNGLVFLALLIFSRTLYRPIWQTIWNNDGHSLGKRDLFIACIGCIISYPLVAWINQLLEIVVYLFFHTWELPNQSAILFLRATLPYPGYFFLTALSILVFAPFTEELLFRGFLQNYLKRYCSIPIAILLTSIIFTLFHYSSYQGLGNIPLFGSLFVLSSFLGFVYERQGSLLTSICFHALFNAINVANLYFFGVS